MTEEKILFWISLLGFNALMILQTAVRFIYYYVNPAGLMVLGPLWAFALLVQQPHIGSYQNELH